MSGRKMGRASRKHDSNRKKLTCQFWKTVVGVRSTFTIILEPSYLRMFQTKQSVFLCATTAWQFVANMGFGCCDLLPQVLNPVDDVVIISQQASVEMFHKWCPEEILRLRIRTLLYFRPRPYWKGSCKNNLIAATDTRVHILDGYAWLLSGTLLDISSPST